MTVTFHVWSTHVAEDKEIEPRDALETRRTNRKVAEEDVGILKSILHRKAWINEVGS